MLRTALEGLFPGSRLGKDLYVLRMDLLCRQIPVISKFLISTQIQKLKETTKMPTKASARNHFMKTQEQLRKKYEALGMTEYQISEMYKFDLNVFNRDIAYDLHTQPLMPEEEDDDIDEGKNPLAKKFIESISVMPDTPMTAKYWWMDEIDDRVLMEKMKKLSLEELDLSSSESLKMFDSV